jgi:murein endopeptidase
MRPVSVFAKDAGCGIEQLEADLRGRRRQVTRAVLLSLHGLPPAQIGALLQVTPPPCAAGSAGSTAKGWPDWRTGAILAAPAGGNLAAAQADHQALPRAPAPTGGSTAVGMIRGRGRAKARHGVIRSGCWKGADAMPGSGDQPVLAR